MKEHFTGIVLAGGKSSRLGRDKSQELVGERTLLHRVVDALAQVADDVLIVMSPDQLLRRIPAHPDVRIVHDLQQGRGPAAGLYAGLRAASSNYAWALGCDLPFLNPNLLGYLMSLAPGYDAVLPVIEDPRRAKLQQKALAQTLHAVYSKRCTEILGQLLDTQAGVAIHDLLPRINVRYVGKVEIDKLDPGLLSFLNVNSQEELERAREISREIVSQ